MAREIELIFPDSNIIAVAKLCEREAPISCEALWKILEKPLEEKLYHGHETGPELWFYISPIPDLPYENATMFPIPGDLLLYHYEGQKPKGEKVYDIGIYYGRGHSLLNVGWTPGNIVATVTENLEGIVSVAKNINARGPERIIVRRKL